MLNESGSASTQMEGKMPNRYPAVFAALMIASAGVVAAPSPGQAGNGILLAQNNDSSTLGSNQQPEKCDCTNCSAEHCQGSEVALVFHTITWTYEPDRGTSKQALLAQAEKCKRQTSRDAAEACLRRNGWKPARK